ncbi:MAG: hypothetical protein LBT95_03340 [Treponema sp.]|jgi:hypothetical protein|nr:hypothetical protein [Treponema sp.]
MVFSKIKKLGFRLYNSLAGKAARVFHRPRKVKAPLADMLLADALRLAEIPSPTPGEEQRAVFVLERLKTLGLIFNTDDEGNILVRLHSPQAADERPLLLFAPLGSGRWHPLESLSRLDAQNALGAGLADTLGSAALLSLAETFVAGKLKNCRDLLLLFAVRSLDDPENRVFPSLLENSRYYPFAALGVQGLSLGRVITHARGSYRILISVSQNDTEEDKKKTILPAGKAPPDEPAEPSNRVTDFLITAARELLNLPWEGEGKTDLYIRCLEAETLFGRTPLEGRLEIELDFSAGSSPEKLFQTLNTVVETLARGTDLKIKIRITSFIPAGDIGINAPLTALLKTVMKEQRIKIKEEGGPDPSAFFAGPGIPALSLGIALGREGGSRDLIEIASVEKGRLLLENLAFRLCKEGL